MPEPAKPPSGDYLRLALALAALIAGGVAVFLIAHLVHGDAAAAVALAGLGRRPLA
jgi:predicted Na+-dependent transporter